MINIKSVIGILICCILLTGISFSVAENGTETAPVINCVYTGSSNSIAIQKTITVTNMNEAVSKVFGPNITYTYQLYAAEDLQHTVTDADNHSVHVLPGKLTALTANPVTASFSSGEVSLNQGKGSVSSTASITFLPVEFGAPGVYRYKIEDQTTAVSLWEAGIIRAENNNQGYYLDVYVGYKDGVDDQGHPYAKVPANLVIQGYAFFGENSDINQQSAKLSAFASNDPSAVTLSSDPVSPVGDLYPTFNVEITQKVEGNMADATHAFPITATVDNNQLHYFTLKGTVSSSSELSENANTTVLSNNEVFHILGLNARAKVSSEERNDTLDLYQVQIDNKTETLEDSTPVAHNETLGHEALSITNWPETNTNGVIIHTTSLTDSNTRIIYTNALNTVSPTGIVRHVAPYALMLVFAFFFAILLKRRREETYEDS